MDTFMVLAQLRYEWAEKQYRKRIQHRVLLYTTASGLMIALGAIAAFRGWI
jgi:hypothetical protein